MGRLVVPRSVDGQLFSGAAAADDYPARVAKYIPAEFVAAYLAADKIIKPDGDWSKIAAPEQNATLALGAFAFVVLLILNGLYLWWRGKRERTPYKSQLGISSVAFLLWAFALPGTLFLPVYSPKWSAVLLIIFSAAAGAFEPSPGKAPADGQKRPDGNGNTEQATKSKPV